MEFQFLCFAIMWLMIFGVLLFYVGMVDVSFIENTLLIGVLSIIGTSLIWLLFGYSLSFYKNFQYSVLSSDMSTQEIVSMLVQLVFCLYAIVMLVGSVLGRGNWKFIAILAPLWMLIVYAPMCFLIWGQDGWLSQLGVKDYSGGLVVHATAGIGSLVLAMGLPLRKEQSETRSSQKISFYIGTIFITLGWFGFNMAPAGEFNQEAVDVWMKTFISIIGGGIAWFGMQTYLDKEVTIDGLLNGMIAGLVASTCSVGYVNIWQSFVIAFVVCLICPVVINYIHNRFSGFDDAVDSFGMNGVGGIVGSILAGIFIQGGQYFGVQLLGTLIVCIWSFVACWVLKKLLARFISEVEPSSSIVKENRSNIQELS